MRNESGGGSRWLTWAGALRGAGASALILVGVLLTPLPNLAARQWAIQADLQPADAIVVLGGGVTWPGHLLCDSVQRLQHGVRLYQEGYARRLILSGGTRRGDQPLPAEADLMAEIAVRLGVRPEDLVLERDSLRTYENGREVAAIMRREGWASALLVTDALHMRRARLVFDRLGIRIAPAPSPTGELLAETPGGRLKVLESLWHELVGTALYKLRGWA